MMSRAALGVVVLALFSARAEDVEPDAPAGVACKGQRSDTDRAYLRVPLHGTLFKGKLHGFFGIQNEKPITSWRQFNLIAVDPRNPDIGKGGEYHFIGRRGFGCRHRIAFGSLWMMQHPGNLVRLKIDELHLFDFLNPDRQKQYAAKYPRGAKPPFGPNLENHSFWLLSLFNRYHIITPASNMVPQPKEVLGFGAVPTSATSCKSYILNAATQQIEAWDSDFVWDDQKVCWEPKPSQQSAKIDQWIKDLDNSIIQRRLQASLELQALGQIARPALEKFIASKPSAEASRRAKEVVEKLRDSPSLDAEDFNYEKFPSLFAEDFDFFLRNNDYYFVTESGKLYMAPAPAKGEKARTMKRLWTDAKRPIVAVIEDADRGKVWLFAKDNNAGAKLDFYFEMQETIRAKSFDSSKLRRVNIEGPARMLLEYLPLIHAGEKK